MTGRPHIEFLFAQALPWTNDCRLESRAELRWKLLSANGATGELSALVRIATHWRMAVTSPFQEELYVLDGDLEIEGNALARDGYARLPPGRAFTWRSRRGAVALVYRNLPPAAATAANAPTTGRMVVSPGVAESPHALEASEPVFVDTTRLPWDDSGLLPEVRYMRLARKALYADADSGGHRTWLLNVAPQIEPTGEQLARETHGCAEESFMLAGDITGPQGVMSPGAYFWRPPETLHGPFGSRQGGLALLRFRDGVQTVRFHAPLPFQFEAPYAPDLPSELRFLTKARRAAGGRY